MIDVDLTKDELELLDIIARLEGGKIEDLSYTVPQSLQMACDYLRKYHRQYTGQSQTDIIDTFERAKISSEDTKSAIACARRLGFEI